jgi:hypothetical protein
VKIPFGLISAIILILLGAVAGCGNQGRSNKAEEESTLKPLAKVYGDFVNQHQGKPPQGETEFKAFLKEARNADMLKSQFQITDIDKLFISSRDNKPYVVYYGTLSQSHGPGGAPVIAYEKEGVKGKRFVASALGAVVELDENAFRAMVQDAR